MADVSLGRAEVEDPALAVRLSLVEVRAEPRPAEDERAPAAEASFGRLTGSDGRRLALAALAVVGAWAVAAGCLAHGDRLVALARGECDLRGRFRYRPRHPVDAAALARMDHDAINARLLPIWVTSAAHLLDDPEAEARAFEALEAAVGTDPNLAELVGEQRRIIVRDEVLARAERLHYLVFAWNRYLDRAGQPYVVDGSVGVGWGRRPFFYVVTYRTVADLRVGVGGGPARVRLVSRADPVDVRELHVGGAGTHTAEEGALVVLDRLQEFALDAVWPLLAAAPGEQPGSLEAAYREAVGAEVEAAIGRERAAVLRRTAPMRRALLEAAHSVAEREPCSGVALVHNPWDGHSPLALGLVVALAELSLGAPCPIFKVEEAVAIHKASLALGAEPALGRSLEALLAFLARSVAVHEARHLADVGRGGGLAALCPDCGSPPVGAEVSAYLGSFAWGEGPATAYYQACRAVQSGRNPHAAAMETIDQWLGRDCLEGPPPDLVGRARRLEAERLGRSEPVTLPETFPASLPIRRGAGLRRAVVGSAQPVPGV